MRNHLPSQPWPKAKRLVVLYAALLLVLASLPVPGQTQTNINVPVRESQSGPGTNQTGQAAVAGRASRAEQIRSACVNGRRCVCGKVIQIVPEGLVVESGYTALMEPPFTGNWVIPSGALVKRDPKLIERDEPASPCIGTVLLIDFPKRPSVQLYDYVILQGYPAGEYLYKPVPGVEKQIRRFAGGLDTAVKLKLAAEK